MTSTYLDDPKALGALLQSLHKPSLSSTGRNLSVMAQSTSTASSSSGGGGAVGGESAAASNAGGTSITAATQRRAMEGQMRLQDAFMKSATSPRIKGAMPSLNVLAVLDEQRAATEAFYMESDPAVVDAAADASSPVSPTGPVIVRVQPVVAAQTISMSSSHQADATMTSLGATAATTGHQQKQTSPHGTGHVTSPRKPLASLFGPSSTLTSPRHPAAPTASFLSPERAKVDSIGLAVLPPVGHYHPKHTLTEERRHGGYIEPQLIHRRTKRTVEDEGGHGSEQHFSTTGRSDGQLQSPTAASPEGSFAYSKSNASLGSPHGSARTRARDKANASPPRVHQPPSYSSVMFQSKSPRIAPYPRGEGADELYWPRCDRYLNGNGQASTGWDFGKTSPRKSTDLVSAAPDTVYNIQSPFGKDESHRTLDINNRTSRDHYPVEKKFFYQKDVELGYDVNTALDATRKKEVPGMVPAFDRHTGPRVAPWEKSSMFLSSADESTAYNADPEALKRRVRGPMPFEKHSPHTQQTFPYVPVVYDVEFQKVEHSPRSAVIHPAAPGHRPLHTTSDTEIGPAPSLSYVRGNTIQNVMMTKQTPRKEPASPIHDLEYAGSTHNPAQRRTTGDPMNSQSLTRAKREAVLTGGQQPGSTDVDMWMRDGVRLPPHLKPFVHVALLYKRPVYPCSTSMVFLVGFRGPGPSMLRVRGFCVTPFRVSSSSRAITTRVLTVRVYVSWNNKGVLVFYLEENELLGRNTRSYCCAKRDGCKKFPAAFFGQAWT
ncbi:Hypothetical protein, putative [Bodo saltans]|uniref:Uncharacterized protein n=1 Tax=Bodo saltans TaxID=75058 RepID=A0A0S4IXF8_BODSA|nr:Hypothetical protein, putative [Bodo saltans]|eukprot:CUG39863.1 Hypothetical protein, putative [Bodo saltans]